MKLFNKHKITRLVAVPELLGVLPVEKIGTLKYIVSSGSPLTKPVAEKLLKIKDCTILNLYGSTEVSADATCCEVKSPNFVFSPIGNPISNTKVYLLNASLQPIPIGVSGELCIGGDGVSRGYLNCPDLTKERFIDNPFASDEDRAKGCNLRLYKTGDMVRWLPDGSLEFIGRNDDQVKIRGFRVELGEIESKLTNHSDIRQCIVTLFKKEDTKSLVAYYVLQPTSNPKPQTSDLINYLSEKLPNYMVPTYFIELDKMPLNTSGKIDKKSLPVPELKGDEDNYLAPRNELERKLCEIWQEILGVDKIGINDDFFRLGGNSISAIKASTQMGRFLKKVIPVKAIFSKKRIMGILDVGNDFNNFEKIDRCGLEKVPLSFAQERLWYLHNHGASVAYKTPLLLDLGENVDLESFKKAVNEIIARHEILRTIIVENTDGTYFQLPQKSEFPIKEFQFNTSEQMRRRLDESMRYVFDLKKEYPVRVEFYSVKEKVYVFFDFHHIAMDGWSQNILFDELEVLYDKYSLGSSGSLSEMAIQYKDFAVWHRNYLAGNIYEEQLDYWKNRLLGYEDLNFPTDFIRPSTMDYSGNNFSFELDLNTSLLLQKLANSKGTTLYNILLTAFYLLLNKYTNQTDLTIGVVNANRHYPLVDKLIGFFVNTFARRFILEEESTVDNLIDSVIADSLRIQDYIDIPFERVVDSMKIKRDASRQPLFNIVFAGQSFGKGIKKFKKLNVERHFKSALFDLTLFIDDNPGDNRIRGIFNYSTSLFKEETIERITGHYSALLRKFVEQIHCPLKEVALLSGQEYQKIVYDWNSTETPYPKDKTIHHLFEEQVEKTPDNVAVIFEDKQLTYRKLNEKANQLAHSIRKEYKEQWGDEVKGDTLIGIYIERGLEMIIGILGILKSGAAYVPFDSADPEERLKFKINDCNCKMILTSSSSTEDLIFLAESDTLPVAIDSYWEEIGKAPKDNLKTISEPTDLAYVIYTSGSTGKPKGVMIEHQGVCNLAKYIVEKFNISEGVKVLQFASICFDASVYEWIGTLTVGGELVLLAENELPPNIDVSDILYQKKINVAMLPPSIISTMRKQSLPELFTIVSGAEVCSLKIVEEWGQNRLFINAYGPTEATVACSMAECKSGVLPNIGSPIPNKTLYVLDDNMRPVPIGVSGELCIGGDGVSRGYLNCPDLTKERFIDNPFASDEDRAKGCNLRLYKTGDMVRWLPDGSLEFIGRNDDQIKIRGFRIELGEIESKLSEHPSIEQCVVTAYRSSKSDLPAVASGMSGIQNQKIICAHYVPDSNNVNSDLRQTDFMSTWESAYDTEYGDISGDIFNNEFSGWNSSYTNKAIPVNEMIEWRDCVIERILQENPSFVYEIGSGTGLIAYPLLEHLKEYVGIDFSEEVVRKLNRGFSRGGICNARLYRARADQLDQPEFFKDDMAIDTVIINSVVQYFPDIEYLEDVINKSVNIIDAGVVFVGDVRDYRLLKEFHTSVELFKLQNDLHSSDFDIAFAVNNNIKNENELLVSPVYFLDLSKRISKISSVEILPKRGSAQHEMNKFRYDVIIHINDLSKENVRSRLKWVAFDLDISLKKQLEENKKCLAVRNYPNKRVINDCEVVSFLSKSHEQLVSEYEKSKQRYNDCYTLEELYELARIFEYELYVSLSVTDKSCYDLIFSKDGNIAALKEELYKDNCMNLFPEKCFNNPTKNFQKKIIPSEELRDYLSLSLPDYMIPLFFIELDKFPLNTSGKIDKKSLPEPVKADQDNYLAPRNELECKLCEIWQEQLGGDRVGVNDDFFKLGGNSISSIQVVNIISNKTELKIKVADIFKYPTIGLLVLNCLGVSTVVIPKTGIRKVPLSFAQERLWFIEQYEGGSNAYNIPIFLELDDSVNLDLVKHSLKSVFERHEIFRTVFVKDNKDVYYQHLLSELPHINDVTVNENDFSSRLYSDINCIFNLSKEHSVKNFIYHTGEKTYLLVNVHHIAFDGWSADIFLKELNSFYNHYSNKAKLTLPDLDIQYRDFAVWQRSYLAGDVLEKLTDYWKNLLEGYETLNFPTDKTRPAEVKYIGDDYSFEIDEKTSTKLIKLAKAKHTTIYNILLTAFYVLLYKYTSQKDMILGTPIANRHYSQLENLMGFFVNSMALRIELDSSDTFLSLSEKVIKLMNEVQEYQDLSFEKMVDILKVPKDPSRNPLFQIMFSVQSFGSSFDNTLFKLCDISKYYKVAKFDLSLFIDDSQEKFKCDFNYATSLFNGDTIKRLSKHYCNILETIVSREDIQVNDIQLLSNSEYNQIVYDWNKTEAPYPKDKTIHQLFEEQVEKTPDNIAVVFEDKELTYHELNEKANQLAHTIRSEYQDHWGDEVKGDALIGIYIERGLEMIIGILGILKSGAAYVPFDTADPEDRLNFKVNDCGCKMVLTSSKATRDLILIADSDTLPLAVDAYSDEIAKASKENPEYINKSTDLAYVIYTSGSTGKPKGVMVEHKNLLNFMIDIKRRFEMSGDGKIISLTNIAFDIFGLEYYLPIISGACLYLISTTVREDVEQLQKYIKQIKPSIIQATPSEWELLSECLDPDADIRILTGGESLPENTALKLLGSLSNIWNMYGPAETTIWSSTCQVVDSNHITIGKPLSNTTFYVLDSNMHPVAIGSPGELYIGGDGLARGYLHRPGLTEERFINNPFASEEDIANDRNLRIYKTGDIVKWLPDGNLTFIGRNDDQVKIRGFRVELGEIESKLSEHPGIKQCVVTLYQQLCAYYVLQSTSNLKPQASDLINYLSERLPDYMVPTYFVELDKMPLNTSGKIDRKALPVPDTDLIISESYIAPRNETEKMLAKIWCDVLQLDKVGVTDDFFSVGGHSLNSIQLISKINKSFNKNLPVIWGFKNPTIEKQGEELANSVILNTEELLVKFNESGYKIPMFFIHPGGMGAEAYFDLASKLNKDQPFYIIDSINQREQKLKFKTIPEYAAEYLKHIKKAQSHGPYYLGGWSFGGVVAYEMAQQLLQEGEKVEKLFLIDSYLSNRRIKKLLQEEHPSSTAYENATKFFRNKLREKMLEEIDLSKDSSYYDFNSEVLNGELNVLEEYEAKRYNGEIILFRASKNNQILKDNKFILDIGIDAFDRLQIDAWESFASNLKIVTIDADHFSIMKDEGLDPIIDTLQA